MGMLRNLPKKLKAAMRKTLYLHIGTHKTGTTSLQEFLAVNSNLLLEYGLYVPYTGVIDAKSGHHNLAWELVGNPSFSASYGTWDDLYEELKYMNCTCAVISSEDFEYLWQSPDKLKNIKALLNSIDYEVVVLYVVRPLSDYLPSLYTELRKHGLLLSKYRFYEHVTHLNTFALQSNYVFCFDFGRMGKSLAAVFGKNNVKCINYSSCIEDVFMEAIGLGCVLYDCEVVPRRNVSFC